MSFRPMSRLSFDFARSNFQVPMLTSNIAAKAPVARKHSTRTKPKVLFFMPHDEDWNWICGQQFFRANKRRAEMFGQAPTLAKNQESASRDNLVSKENPTTG